jgi:hypothetical protein
MRARSSLVVAAGALALFFSSSSDAFAQSVPASAAAPATVNVHVRSDRPVTLVRQGEEQPEAGARPPWDDGTEDAAAYNRRPHKRMQWVPVCESPCDRDLAIAADYRLDADGIRASKVFRLVGRPGERVIVTLDPSTNGSFATGIAIAGVGVAGIATGVILLAGAFSEALLGNDHPEEVNAGLGCLLGGGIVTLVGGIVFFNTRRSSASLSLPSDSASPASPAAPASPPPTSAPEASLRGAIWRDPPTSTGRAATVSVPIWSTTF